jgi:hypothetical protein
MNILRTESGGRFTENERLEKIRVMLMQVDFYENEILELHDHKGILTVYWMVKPSKEQKKLLKYIWHNFNEYEIYHKYVSKTFPK